MTRDADEAPLLTVLLPVRNGEPHLESWLTSVGEYADAVISLDDGSTDRTREILVGADLVTTVLTNPVRPGYLGWDDRENRQRLVDAAVEAGSGWALFLDADERLDRDDGQTLRTFLRTEARRGFAYGFELFAMVEDEHHRDPRGLWVVRLFHCDDALEPLPSRRLHFVPVPANVGRSRWLYTSLRIQHYGGSTERHRRERRAKYAEVDPDDEFHQDYDRLLLGPSRVEPWPPRGDVPVVLGRKGRHVDLLHAGHAPSEVALSAVVIAQNDAETIERSIGALVHQELDDDFEVILVDSGSDDTVCRVREQFPSVRCVHLPEAALPGEARNAGLLMARGEFLSFPGSHVWLTPGSLQARLDAHDAGWAMVTGSVSNGNTASRAGWASYFLDHAGRMPGGAPGPLVGPPGSASYVTEDVRWIGGFPDTMRAGEDTVVNQALYAAGRRAYFCPDASFFHASPCGSLRELLAHHYRRGRGLGQIIADQEDGRRLTLRRLGRTREAALNRTRRLRAHIRSQGPDVRERYQSVRWYVRAGAAAYVAGSLRELGRRGHEVTGGLPPRIPASTSPDAPLLAIGGRPGSHGLGILGMGGPHVAAGRLATMVRYANHRTQVIGALAPVVVSATVTAERAGTYTMEMNRRRAAAYLDAARDVGACMLLQIQPGGARLVDLVERWWDMLREPDVGVLFDLRDAFTRLGQAEDLPEVIADLRARVGPTSSPVKRVHVRGVDPGRVPEQAVFVDCVDLREVGAPFPHDLFASRGDVRAVVYD